MSDSAVYCFGTLFLSASFCVAIYGLIIEDRKFYKQLRKDIQSKKQNTHVKRTYNKKRNAND